MGTNANTNICAWYAMLCLYSDHDFYAQDVQAQGFLGTRGEKKLTPTACFTLLGIFRKF